MAQLTTKDLLDAGVHFGHLTRKWDPRMAPYIFMEKNGIHIIDLNKSLASLEQAQAYVKGLVRSGKKIMFVATKKQAQEIVAEEAKRLKMPFVTERWLGGMLTNFSTIRKSLKKLNNIERMLGDEETAKNIAKRERLMLSREKIKLERLLGGVADMGRIPAALFVVDIKREHLAISEAKRLGIPVVGLVDTNSNPEIIQYPIPANDDAYKSVNLLTLAIGKAIEEGILERKQDKDKQELQEAEEAKKAMDAGKAKAAAAVAAEAAAATANDEEGAGEEAAPATEEVGKRKRTRTATASAEKVVIGKEETPKAAEAPKVAEVEAPVVEAPKVEAPKVAEVEAPVVEAPKVEAPKVDAKEEVKAEKPGAKKKTAKSEGDDLTKIEGIGPKMSSVFTEAGLGTFKGLSEKSPEELRAILDAAEGNYAAHDPKTWPQQAGMAAEGKWDELKKWQDELDGGK